MRQHINAPGRLFAAACLLGDPQAAWAASATAAGIDPTVFVLGLLAAFAAGIAVGYAVAKASSK